MFPLWWDLVTLWSICLMRKPLLLVFKQTWWHRRERDRWGPGLSEAQSFWGTGDVAQVVG